MTTRPRETRTALDAYMGHHAATLALLARIPPGRIVVTESGIVTTGDAARMRAAGVDTFQVGNVGSEPVTVLSIALALPGGPFDVASAVPTPVNFVRMTSLPNP